MTNEARLYKEQATVAATELGYPKSVLKALSQAKTEREIIRIMTNARWASDVHYYT